MSRPLRKTLIRWSFLIATIYFLSCNRAARSITANQQAHSDSLSFLVVGDWGKKGKQAQKRVAAAMAHYAQKHPVQFIISTGDNFYWEGVSSTSDPHWKASFENIYTHASLQVPWYPVLGNHDHARKPEAQVQYSALSKRWHMPGFYYTVTKDFSSKLAARLVFIDTSPFISDYYPDGLPNLHQRDTAAQREWLQKELKNSAETWKIVIGHHPVYSAGKHGDSKDMQKTLQPLFEKEKVDFYLSGHDHSLQYLTNKGIYYIVSGGGSERTPVYPHAYDVFTRSQPGFLVLTLYADKARFYFYNGMGKLLYSKEVRK